MPTFEVVVERTVWVSLEIEADTKEKAEALAREQIETDYMEDPFLWKDYYNDPGDIKYDVIPSS